MKYKYTIIQNDRLDDNEYDDDWDGWKYPGIDWGGSC